ncbi:TPA: hypothetical protein ACTW6G_002910 [Raoultella ornithinolytica]
MDNLEKMTAVGKLVYGENWQSPLSRAMDIDSRTIRRFVSGHSKIPANLSPRLLAAMEHEMEKIKSAIELINSDKMRGDDITLEMLAEIADRYEYADQMAREHVIDTMNNAIYEETFLSDLDAIARKFSL